jgi:hypothetical protein
VTFCLSQLSLCAVVRQQSSFSLVQASLPAHARCLLAIHLGWGPLLEPHLGNAHHEAWQLLNRSLKGLQARCMLYATWQVLSCTPRGTLYVVRDTASWHTHGRQLGGFSCTPVRL